MQWLKKGIYFSTLKGVRTCENTNSLTEEEEPSTNKPRVGEPMEGEDVRQAGSECASGFLSAGSGGFAQQSTSGWLKSCARHLNNRNVIGKHTGKAEGSGVR